MINLRNLLLLCRLNRSQEHELIVGNLDALRQHGTNLVLRQDFQEQVRTDRKRDVIPFVIASCHPFEEAQHTLGLPAYCTDNLRNNSQTVVAVM